MKKISLLVILNAFLLINSFGYQYRNKAMVLFDYDLTIYSELNPALEKYIDKFPAENNEIRIEKRIKAMLYSHLEDRLKMEVGLDIQPIRSFTNKIKYDNTGFPDISIQRAIKKSNSKVFFEVEIEIKDNLDKGQTEFGKVISSIDSVALNDTTNLNPFKPEIQLNFYVYNNFGYLPIEKYEVNVRSNKTYTYDNSIFLNGIINNEEWKKELTILSLFDRAVTDLIFKIND